MIESVGFRHISSTPPPFLRTWAQAPLLHSHRHSISLDLASSANARRIARCAYRHSTLRYSLVPSLAELVAIITRIVGFVACRRERLCPKIGRAGSRSRRKTGEAKHARRLFRTRTIDDMDCKYVGTTSEIVCEARSCRASLEVSEYWAETGREGPGEWEEIRRKSCWTGGSDGVAALAKLFLHRLEMFPAGKTASVVGEGERKRFTYAKTRSLLSCKVSWTTVDVKSSCV